MSDESPAGSERIRELLDLWSDPGRWRRLRNCRVSLDVALGHVLDLHEMQAAGYKPAEVALLLAYRNSHADDHGAALKALTGELLELDSLVKNLTPYLFGEVHLPEMVSSPISEPFPESDIPVFAQQTKRLAGLWASRHPVSYASKPPQQPAALLTSTKELVAARPDGPFEPRGFAYQGRTGETTQLPAWKLIKAMWGHRWKSRAAVVADVWGAGEERSDDTLHTTTSRAAELMESAGYPECIRFCRTPEAGFEWIAATERLSRKKVKRK